ncbi:MAG TPA: acyl-CoA dehydrogenase family protein [Chloroflexota bacterium]|nr:acyl-CoA dehydrogenase family protein [Chloroflexota bacterium]
MNFELTDEQALIQQTAREFAQSEVAPRAAAFDQGSEFPYEIVEQMAQLGFMGLPVPEEYGGAGADTLSYALAVEEISRADASTGITLAAHVSLGTMPFVYFGTEEQKRAYVPPLASGERLWAFGLTEPNAGSDAGAAQTSAVLSDGTWTVNGAKAFITNSGTRISAGVTITALTGRRADGGREISNLIVPAGTPGYVIAKDYHKMGWRASDTHELSFQDARVPEENLLGERGAGMRQFLTILDGGRISVAALSVGLAQACLDASLKYSKERVQFGKPIASFEAVQFKLAEMATKIEHARLMTYKAAWLKDTGREFATTAGMAKLYASRIATECADEAVQIHGGYGIMEEYPVARYWRDVKIGEIGEGTSEIQKLIIARALGI